MLRILRYIHRKLLIESVFVLVASSAIAIIDDDPTSDKALEREEVFLDEIERNAFAEHKNLNKAPVYSQTSPAKVEDNSQKGEPIFLDNSPKPNVVKKTGHPLKKQKNDLIVTPKLSIAPKSKKNDRKEVFAGCYGGILGGTSHRYAEANLWSIAHQPIMPKDKMILVDPSEINTIYYGSYSYNNNSYLINGALFLGYDFRMTKLFRVGIEFQGEMEWRKMELCSNGVYGTRAKGARIKVNGKEVVLPETFNYENKLWNEVDFAYIRQTMQMPYNFSLLPRIGIAISENSLIYTKFGVMYGPVEVIDHPETIEPCVTDKSKIDKDTIYNNARTSVVGGIGFETVVTKQLFLRMECLYSQGPTINLDKNDLQNEKNPVNKNRQLKNFNIKSIKNFSIGLGAGVRF